MRFSAAALTALVAFAGPSWAACDTYSKDGEKPGAVTIQIHEDRADYLEQGKVTHRFRIVPEDDRFTAIDVNDPEPGPGEGKPSGARVWWADEKLMFDEAAYSPACQ